MIDGDNAINYLKDKLIELIDNKVINGSYRQSKSTISFYVSDIEAINRPLLSIRLSDHHADFFNYGRNNTTLPIGDDNISVELYKPIEGLRNRTRTNVNIYYSTVKPDIQPFSITAIEYKPTELEDNDIELIYQAILNWIKSTNTSTQYEDPFKDDAAKKADVKTYPAKIKLKREVTQAEKDFYMRYGLGDSYNYNINTMTNNKKKALYESIMKDVAKIVKSRLNESFPENAKLNNIRFDPKKIDSYEIIESFLKGVEPTYIYKGLYQDIDDIITNLDIMSEDNIRHALTRLVLDSAMYHMQAIKRFNN